MLTEFDQNTIAKLTAALEYVCKRIPKDQDGHEIRKRIADAMVMCGHSGRRSLTDFQDVGMKVLDEIIKPPKTFWLSFWRSKRAQ